ncbi:MAG TPA: IS110 family transposase [Bryobacteraceae bacterium]|jgi:transposase
MNIHRIAGIDVHKKMLAVVVWEAPEQGEWVLQRRKFLTTSEDLDARAAWLAALEVQEVVMESTAQYWKPVWRVLQPQCRLELAQAQSNRGPRGRKNDFGDAERLVRRYMADELILSFVPDPRQRLWRALSRTKQTLTHDQVRLRNRVEGLLEEMCLKLSSLVSDLLGVSARRMLAALAEGETDPDKLAGLADPGLRATREQLCDALRAAPSIPPAYRRLLKQYLERIELQERQIAELDRELGTALKQYEDAVVRLAEVPGLGADSAQQIIAEVGPQAAVFPTAADLCSWVGTCPGQEESAEQSRSDHSPKGNRPMRRILDQAAQAAIKSQGTVFESHYRRIRGRDAKKHNVAVWAVANRLCRLIWKILHQGVKYEERGHRTNLRAVRERATRLIRQLRGLGYSVQVSAPPAAAGAA